MKSTVSGGSFSSPSGQMMAETGGRGLKGRREHDKAVPEEFNDVVNGVNCC